MALTAELRPAGCGTAFALLLLGCVVQAVSVVLDIMPRVVMMSAEGFVDCASRRYGKDFGKFKVRFDLMLVLSAVLISWLFARRVEGARRDLRGGLHDGVYRNLPES